MKISCIYSMLSSLLLYYCYRVVVDGLEAEAACTRFPVES